MSERDDFAVDANTGCIECMADIEALEIHDGRLWAITAESVVEVPIPPDG